MRHGRGSGRRNSTPATTQQAKPKAEAALAKPGDQSKDAANKSDGVHDLSGGGVTGIRASMESAQSLKQNASQIIDSVTATDINALPDRSVTETLQHISGVTVDHFLADDNPDHLAA